MGPCGRIAQLVRAFDSHSKGPRFESWCVQEKIRSDGFFLGVILLRQAARNKKRIKIIYLKGKDEKSERIVIPRAIKEDEYAGHDFLALRAWCELRQEERTFNVERILQIEE